MTRTLRLACNQDKRKVPPKTARTKVFSFLAFQVFSFLAFGQPTAPPLQDPLISLMASQPRLDITSVVTATAAFDPPVVGPDELSVYRVTFNALEQSIEWPEQLSI